MFDVLWTDPNRELLKERMVKREQEGKTKGKNKRSQSTRRSISTNSSSSSDRGFGLFMTKNRKFQGTPPKIEKPTAISELSIDEGVRDRRASAYGIRSLLSHPDGSELTVKPSTGLFLPIRKPPTTSDAASSKSSRGKYITYSVDHAHLLIFSLYRLCPL